LKGEIGRPVVPSAHIFTGGAEAGTFAEGLEQAVFIDGRVKRVIGLKLLAKGAIEEFDIAIAKLGEDRRGDRGCEVITRTNQASSGNGSA
jgi:hypothetical protein